jgi:putative peptide zinc metalloprotease protein
VVRFDGHYVLSDLTGVPDILSRVRPALRSLIPGRKPDPRVEELRPLVRRVLLGYALITALALAAGVAIFLHQLPHMVTAAVAGSRFEGARLVAGLAASDWVAALTGALGVVTLSLPLLGAALTVALMGNHARRAARSRGLGVRTLLWPEPGRAPSALAWNSLHAAAGLLALASLVITAQGAAGGAIRIF